MWCAGRPSNGTVIAWRATLTTVERRFPGPIWNAGWRVGGPDPLPLAGAQTGAQEPTGCTTVKGVKILMDIFPAGQSQPRQPHYEERRMLTLQEIIDFAEIERAQLDAISELEHVPEVVAAEMAPGTGAQPRASIACTCFSWTPSNAPNTAAAASGCAAWRACTRISAAAFPSRGCCDA